MATAAPALAFGFVRGERMNGLPEDVQQEFLACKDLATKEETQQCRQSIMNTYREENGIEDGVGWMGGHAMRPRPAARRLSDEEVDQLKACFTGNEDRDVIRICYQEVMQAQREANEITEQGFGSGSGMGMMRGDGLGPMFDEELRAQMQACEDNNEDRADIRACRQELTQAHRTQMQERRQHCEEQGFETSEEMCACMREGR